MTAPACPVRSRLYQSGRVIAEDFGAEETAARLRDHPDAVVWLDLFAPRLSDLEAIAADFGLHPLAVEDAVEEHQRPKLDRYADHVFVSLYAVDFHGAGAHKVEIGAFITERALITVRKQDFDLEVLRARWDGAVKDGLAAGGGVNFLVYGLFDVVVDSQYAAARAIDEAMDAVEDQMLEEGGAPRDIRMHAFGLRKAVANLRRAAAPMADVVDEVGRGVAEPGALRPYFRDVADHAHRAREVSDHAYTRISELLDADLAEQSNVLNEVTRKLAAWAAIIAVPTALTGYFGQNLPYPGYERWWGFVLSTGLIVICGSGLYVYLKRRGWL